MSGRLSAKTGLFLLGGYFLFLFFRLLLRTIWIQNMVGFFNRQSSYPAINIGHLGTSVPYQSKGIGTAIIDLVADTFTEYRQAGCQFITVDALNHPKSIKFYHTNGFLHQTNKDMGSATRRMYRMI